ncbi:14295_t:CDS:1, partial [Racocetra fulgida]
PPPLFSVFLAAEISMISVATILSMKHNSLTFGINPYNGSRKITMVSEATNINHNYLPQLWQPENIEIMTATENKEIMAEDIVQSHAFS